MNGIENEAVLNSIEIMSERSESFNGESQSVPGSDEDTEQETPPEIVVDININSEVEEHIHNFETTEHIHNFEIEVNSNNSEIEEHINNPETVVHTNNSETAEPPPSKPLSIFRVPAHVREVDERAYNPKIVSIGPFHHNEPGLKAFEAHKERFLRQLLKQMISEQNRVESLENAMKKLEEKTRKCYSESFDDINSDDFVQMMVLDGCFIVEFLRLYDRIYKPKQGGDVEKPIGEPIFAKRWMPVIGRDLLMVENQLPMFVLQKLFKLTDFNREASSLNKLALQFFEPLRPGKDKLPIEKLDDKDEYHHLLALFQSSFVPSANTSSPIRQERCNKYGKPPRKGWVRNATTLSYAGVRFKNKSGSLLDIEFEDKFLRIPTLFIDNGTSSVLSNLVAYEQCNRDAAPYFTYLAVFLDSIVDKPKDINILRGAGIIRQAHGGDEEVVNLLKSLTKELEYDMDDCYITKQIEDINHFCRSGKAQFQICVLHILFETQFPKFFMTYLSSVITTVIYASFYSPN